MEWRGNVRPVLVLIVVGLGMAFLPSAFPPPSQANMERESARIGWTDAIESDHIARDIHLRVNDERRARGLPPLAWSDELADLSRRWSEEMIATGYRHSPRWFRELPDLGVGENISMGPTSASVVHVGWMLSDGHRQNLLLPSHTEMGVGVVCRKDGRMWATQMFGTPRGVAVAGATALPPVEPIVRRDDGPACPSPIRWDLRQPLPYP